MKFVEMEERVLKTGQVVEICGVQVRIVAPTTAVAMSQDWAEAEVSQGGYGTSHYDYDVPRAEDDATEDLPEPDKTVAQQAKALLERNDL